MAAEAAIWIGETLFADAAVATTAATAAEAAATTAALGSTGMAAGAGLTAGGITIGGVEAGLIAAGAGAAGVGVLDAAFFGTDTAEAMGSWETLANLGSGFGADLAAINLPGTTAGAGAGGWGSVSKMIAPAMNIGSGLYGMSQADKMRKQSDPWGTMGGREQAGQQLQQLMLDPNAAAAQDPSYALRMQGAQRATAMMGQGSGAMAAAGANASTGWYDQRLAQLSNLAGAGPVGQQTGYQGNVSANTLASQSLASIGYGATRAGGNQQLPPALIAQLQAAGYNL